MPFRRRASCRYCWADDRLPEPIGNPVLALLAGSRHSPSVVGEITLDRGSDNGRSSNCPLGGARQSPRPNSRYPRDIS
jgi:hypothetical protein